MELEEMYGRINLSKILLNNGKRLIGLYEEDMSGVLQRISKAWENMTILDTHYI